MLFVPPNIPPVPDEVTARFGVIIDWLRRAIAALAGKNRAIVPIVVLLHGRLGRIIGRFEILVAKIRAGQVPPPPRDPAKRTPRKLPEAPPDKTPVRLPSGFGWLGQMGGPDVRAFGGQLAHLLTDPEMKAMLASDPRVGRLLRPLLWMLGVDRGPAGVPPPPPRRAPRPTQTDDAPSPMPPASHQPMADAPSDPPGSAGRAAWVRPTGKAPVARAPPSHAQDPHAFVRPKRYDIVT